MKAPNIVQFYYDFLKSHPTDSILNLLFLFLIPVQDVFLPHLYGYVILAFQNKTDIFKPFMLVLVTMIILQVCFYLEDWHDSHLYPKLQDFLRAKLLTKILDKYETSYQELNIGEIISVFTKAPVTMTLWFERMKNNILPLILTFVIAVIYFMVIDVPLGIMLFILCTTFVVIMLLAPRGCNDITFHRDKSLNSVHEEIDDMLRNLFSIYGQNQKDNEILRTKEFEALHDSLFKKTVNCIFKYKIWVMPICIGFLCFFMFRCYHLYISQKIDSGKFVPLFIIMMYVLSSMIYTNDQFRDIVFDWGVINATDALIEPRPPVQKRQDDVPMTVPSTGIGFKNVSFKYEVSRHNVIDDVTFHIEDKQKVIIMGDIGSGKSTILKLLMKYYEPQQGTVYWKGTSFDNIDLKELRKRIGYVPQVPILFNRSIIDNITYGNNTPREKVIDMLQEHNILKEFANMEMGLDTPIGKNGSRLSGGQRQLVWCLRVLLNAPDIIILDEPTASIDLNTKHVLNTLLDKVMKDKIVIMVTHDEYLMNKADRLIVMQHGKIVKDVSAFKQ